MPPKKGSVPVREDTANSDSVPREGRAKRGHNQRDAPEEPSTTSNATPSFNIESLDRGSLMKYRKVMHLPPPPDRFLVQDNLVEAPKRFQRVEKEEELVNAVKRHWSSTQCKETEVITSFMYSVKNQNKTFKLRFVEASRN